jgi:hypothetical protein
MMGSWVRPPQSGTAPGSKRGAGAHKVAFDRGSCPLIRQKPSVQLALVKNISRNHGFELTEGSYFRSAIETSDAVLVRSVGWYRKAVAAACRAGQVDIRSHNLPPESQDQCS